MDAAVVAGRFRNQLDVLLVVDLDEGDPVAAVGFGQRERLLEAEEVPIEAARLGQIADEQRHVRDPQHTPRRLGCGGGWLGAPAGRRDESEEEQRRPLHARI